MAADILVEDSEAVCASLHNRLKSAFSSSSIENETSAQQAMERTPAHPPDIRLRDDDVRRSKGISATRAVIPRREEPEMSVDGMRILGCLLGAAAAVCIGLLIAWIGVL